MSIASAAKHYVRENYEYNIDDLCKTISIAFKSIVDNLQLLEINLISSTAG